MSRGFGTYESLYDDEANKGAPEWPEHFPDKVGRDATGEICVRFRGEIQRPRFQTDGAAQAFLDGLQKGTRQPEPEGRTQ